MENKKIKKYEKITKIVGIIIGLILVFGISYAVFKTVTRGQESNTISAGKLDVQIENEQNEITIEKAYPIRDKEGLKQTPYTFDIVNKGSINAEYDLYIEIEENTTLPTEVVRYYLTVEEEGVEKIVTEKARLISQEETTEREGKRLYKIDTKYLDEAKTNKYKLYLWIDYEATKEQASNKYFEAKIVVDAVQIYDKNRLVKQVDVSASKDGSVLAYMYADGTVYIKGQGTIASYLSIGYEKEGVLEKYKKVFIQMGCNEEEVNAITSFEELEEYMNNFTEEEENNFYVVLYKETLEEMGQDTSSITDMDSLMSYLVEIGYMDEEGNPTEEGNEFFAKVEEKVNNEYSPEQTPATKIVLEDGIENIPNGLYTANEAITEVRIPASVRSIDERAFYGCRGLTEIVIPDSVTNIGNSAFEGCSNLKEIIIPNSVTSIENYAFRSCTNLTSIAIPESVTNIGNFAFYGCRGLTEITLSKSITNIGNFAFSICTSLTSITIPENVTSIGDQVFSGCTSLTSIEIPNGVTSIGEFAFRNCKSLTAITIPNSVTSIGYRAFASCGSLAEIEIPSSVTSIGDSAFLECIGIKKLIIDGTKNYKDLEIINIEELVITGAGNMYDFSTLDDIPWYSSSSSIKKVTLNDTLTSIGSQAFYNCTSLKEIEISESVTSIGNLAFFSCSSLTEIVIPNSVTDIGNDAFYRCTGLTNITIPNSVTSIGNDAFAYCTSLTEIEIPNSVTSIGNWAFSGCTGVKKLIIDGTKNYGDLEISNIEELVITGTGNMYNYSTAPWYSSGSSIKKVIISDTLTSIGNYAFYGCTGLTNITIPESVTSIGSNVFSECTGIKKLTIDGTKNYGDLEISTIEELIITGTGNMYDYSFRNRPWYSSCSSIKKVTLSDTLTSIGNYAFRSCANLTSIAIPDSVTSIGNDAFYGCTSLTSIEISNNVTSIGEWAFYGCTSLTSLTIPNSVVSTGNYAFNSWASSQTINIDNTEEYVNANWNNYWKSGCSAQINYLRS